MKDFKIDLTPAARQALDLAYRKAHKLHHIIVSVSHLLLAIIELRSGTAADALRKLGFNIDDLGVDIERKIGARSGPGLTCRDHITTSLEFDDVLIFAQREAKALGHKYVDTGDLLIGILLEGGSVAVNVLKGKRLISVEDVRQTISSEIDQDRQWEGKRIDKQEVEELGNHFVSSLEEIIRISNVNGCAMRRTMVFHCLELLLITNYSFSKMPLEMVVGLVRNRPTVDNELITLCNILKAKNPNGLPDLQNMYNGSDTGSTLEGQVGRLLQVWTGKPPQKSGGPPVDWLKDLKLSTTGNTCRVGDPGF